MGGNLELNKQCQVAKSIQLDLVVGGHLSLVAYRLLTTAQSDHFKFFPLRVSK